MKLLGVVVSLLASALGYTEYGEIIPNSLNVVVDGVKVVGLGHDDFTSGGVSSSKANPFGLDSLAADREIGLGDPDAFWAALCDLDSDGDGVSNKDELCDPDCNQARKNPACAPGEVLTHPGFAPGEGEPRSAEADEEEEYGFVTIFGWVFFVLGCLFMFFKVGTYIPVFFAKKNVSESQADVEKRAAQKPNDGRSGLAATVNPMNVHGEGKAAPGRFHSFLDFAKRMKFGNGKRSAQQKQPEL